MQEAIKIINDHNREGARLREAYLNESNTKIASVALVLSKALASGNKILICGNGGSAADAQHFAAELVGRYSFERPGLPAIALTVDTSILTAVGNDYGFEDVFARQVNAHSKAGDVFIAISTSGNSPNIIKAIEAARKNKLYIIGLTGFEGGKMLDMCDEIFAVPHKKTPLVQEVHISVLHLLCRLIDYFLFENASLLKD